MHFFSCSLSTVNSTDVNRVGQSNGDAGGGAGRDPLRIASGEGGELNQMQGGHMMSPGQPDQMRHQTHAGHTGQDTGAGDMRQDNRSIQIKCFSAVENEIFLGQTPRVASLELVPVPWTSGWAATLHHSNNNSSNNSNSRRGWTPTMPRIWL